MKWCLLRVLPLLFLTGSWSLYGQDAGNVVSFSSKAYSPSIGTYGEFAFAWGNGKVVSVAGDSIPLTFDAKTYAVEGPELNCLQTKPFIVDATTRSVNFSLGYRFYIEARERSKELMSQGLMELDLMLYDVQSGKVQVRRNALAEKYSIDVDPGKDYESSGFDEVSIDIDPSWVSSGPREVVLRIVPVIIPGELVNTIEASTSESFPESLLRYRIH